MIRHVVLGWLRPGIESERAEKALHAYRALQVNRMATRVTAGMDLGLRAGNASFAIVIDLPDEGAYRVYDTDEEHQRLRSELFAPIIERLERVQLHVPDMSSE